MDNQRHEAPLTNHALSSSPLVSSGLLSPTRTSRGKEKRAPSVTPRRFGRFFNPRTYQLRGRRILGYLDDSSTNQRPISPQSIFSDALVSEDLDGDQDQDHDEGPASPASPTQRLSEAVEDESRKRKFSGRPEPIIKRRGLVPGVMPPPQLNLPGPSSQVPWSLEPIGSGSQDSLEELRRATLSRFFRASRGCVQEPTTDTKSLTARPTVVTRASKTYLTLEGYQPQPIRRFGNRGFAAQLLDREHGFSSHAGMRHVAFPAADYRTETANFSSRSYDTYTCNALEGQGSSIPFSLASCHSAPVTVIGDEECYLRFFNTTATNSPSEQKVSAYTQVHSNAIMDLAISEDDLRLATACGDRTAQIIDLPTQSSAAILGRYDTHLDSLRQVTFQPGESMGNVLATSDRAGRVHVWDLRCSQAPTNSFSTRSSYGGLKPRDASLPPVDGRSVNVLDNTHHRTVVGVTSAASVTALQWMPAGQEHLLLSASEANAVIKLWDTRYIKPRRQAEEIPLAATTEPETHRWRPYGITSMAISSDATRLYVVCKDSTIYAYSTEHLMLGHAPELLPGATKRRPAGAKGLGPLYGLKHDSFRADSFYVKCALRPAADQHSSELLAVGSSDHCAVLFPTDERYIRSACARKSHILDTSSPSTMNTPRPQSSCSLSSASNAPTSSIPIFRHGTSLVRGHSREVTTVSWSHEGRLITASDDYSVRQWQEDANQARHLRQIGEFGGERHMAGWAHVEDDWDEEE